MQRERLNKLAIEAGKAVTDAYIAMLIDKCEAEAKRGNMVAIIDGYYNKDVQEALRAEGLTVTVTEGNDDCGCSYGCNNCRTTITISWA